MIDYSRINFVDYPLIATPLNATTLNKIDKAIYDLDAGIGDATDASSVTGNTVFAKIGTLYTALSTLNTTVSNKVKYNGTGVSSIDFSVSDSVLIITTT